MQTALNSLFSQPPGFSQVFRADGRQFACFQRDLSPPYPAAGVMRP